MGRPVYDAVDGSSAGIANDRFWHKPDLRLAASEGRFTGGLPTLGAEGLLSGGKPTIFFRALKVGR